MQVNLPKPIGVRFGRGNDGAAYVIKSDDALGNTDDRIEVRSTTHAFVMQHMTMQPQPSVVSMFACELPV